MIGPAILPPALSGPGDELGLELLSVRPHEVERGDVILGMRSPVESVLFHGSNGCWYYTDRIGTVLCRRPAWATVQVIRGGLSSDDTPPRGIGRVVA